MFLKNLYNNTDTYILKPAKFTCIQWQQRKVFEPEYCRKITSRMYYRYMWERIRFLLLLLKYQVVLFSFLFLLLFLRFFFQLRFFMPYSEKPTVLPKFIRLAFRFFFVYKTVIKSPLFFHTANKHPHIYPYPFLIHACHTVVLSI